MIAIAACFWHQLDKFLGNMVLYSSRTGNSGQMEV